MIYKIIITLVSLFLFAVCFWVIPKHKSTKEKGKSTQGMGKSDPEMAKLKLISLLFLIAPISTWIDGWKYAYAWNWVYIAILLAVAYYAITQKIREERKEERQDEEK